MRRKSETPLGLLVGPRPLRLPFQSVVDPRRRRKLIPHLDGQRSLHMSHATTESHDTHFNTVARLSDRTRSANGKPASAVAARPLLPFGE